MTTQNINMDLIPGGNSRVIRVSQYDHESRTYKITLTHNNKNDFTIPEDVTVEVRGTKPSGKSFVYPCAFEGNVVTLVIKDQMTAEHGTVKAELVLLNGSVRLGAGNFDIIVEKASFTPDNVTNSDTFDSLVEDAVVKCANENLIELYVDVELNPESDAPVGNKVICNNFANAIKGYVAGSVVEVDDVSPIEHNLNVWVHKKNLVDPGNIVRSTYVNVNYTESQLAITKTNAFEVWANVYIDMGEYSRFINKTLTLSLENLNTYGWSVLLVALDSNNQLLYEVAGKSSNLGLMNFTTAIPYVSGASRLAIRIVSGDNSIATGETYILQNIQVEIGKKVTSYEVRFNPSNVTFTDGKGETHVPNEDGVVEGVISTSPSMTLSTNDADVVIECEYIRDSTKVINKLTDAIIALGGSV